MSSLHSVPLAQARHAAPAAPPGPPPPTLEAATAAVQGLPSLPGSTRQLLGYLNDESVDLKIIVRAIECDPGLALGVLRIANSAFYAMPKQVHSIHDAVVLLGFSKLHMVIVASMAAMLQFPNLDDAALVRQQLRHSLAVAIGAAVLARQLRLDANALFLAGILHDVGVLALMSTYPQLHARARALAQREQCLLSAAEHAVFGFDHAEIGASLCRHWNLPQSIVLAIGSHHHSDSHTAANAPLAQPPSQPPGAADLAAGVVQLSDAIAHTLNLEQAPQPREPLQLDVLWQRLGGSPTELAPCFAATEKLFKELVVLLAPD